MYALADGLSDLGVRDSLRVCVANELFEFTYALLIAKASRSGI